jgi:hypothetical protein
MLSVNFSTRLSTAASNAPLRLGLEPELELDKENLNKDNVEAKD